MSRHRALLALSLSLVVLVGAGALWALQSDGGSADLVGAPVTTTSVTTTTAPTATVAPTTSTTVPPPAAPVGLSIPSLGVAAQVVPVGLEPDGEMEVPPAMLAGWYRYSPPAGSSTGTTVLAAHVDYGGQRGVFFDLRELQVGSEVTVTDEAGSAHRYLVTERYQVDKDELPIEQIFVADGPPGLTMITCGGSFDRGQRSYRDNIVVRAQPA